mmetsp:Transcript_10028/g.23319  ORF Transcript_10028/g.23319 Transcript_10028/m.23319 type:complete len:211 (-) Transcript_10028:19-651(-)
MAASAVGNAGRDSPSGTPAYLHKVNSENNVVKYADQSSNKSAHLDSFAEAAAEKQDKKKTSLRRSVTEPCLHSCEPAAASEFDTLFGRAPSGDYDEYKPAQPKKMASAFDVFFGGCATVVEDGPDAPRIPDPSRPIDVFHAKPRASGEGEAGALSRSRSRPDKLPSLVIPEEKAEDPSDKPEHVDQLSPRTLLDQGVLQESSSTAPPVPA